MDNEFKVKTAASEEKRQLIERIDRLEVGFIMLLNQLRGTKSVPEHLLDVLEKMVLKRN